VARSLPLGRTTVGRKAIMAVTGMLLYVFVVVHMIGNLKFFTGPLHFDSYAEWLRTIGTPLLLHGMYLWIQRGALLLALLLHIWAAWSLTRVSHAARPVAYAANKPVQATVAARTMRWGGIALGLFIVFHILQFTTGTLGPHYVKAAVYDNVVHAFKLWYNTVVYIAAMAALSLHLYHGVWSMTQTLGLNRPSLNRAIYRFSQASAAIIFLGFVSVPVAVLAGVRP
jgi:succinate dehydrogenase / fumarate reductase cytochrome b subunit